jgi:hypothetical protein
MGTRQKPPLFKEAERIGLIFEAVLASLPPFPAQVTPRELVYRLVAIAKSLVLWIILSIKLLFYRYKCGRNGRFDCCPP